MFNNDKLKVFYDAEFTGLNSNSTLISIGLVSESSRWFYAEFTDYDTTHITDWIQNNVINNLVLSDSAAGGYKIKTKDTTDENNFYCMVIKDTTDNVKVALLEWLQNESRIANGKQIQIYSDCYAYDWVLFNNLVSENGNALNIPEFIYYIPVDLSTALQVNNIDPDITREDFIGENVLNALKVHGVFKNFGDRCKHNSLWDASVCRNCFNKLGMI